MSEAEPVDADSEAVDWLAASPELRVRRIDRLPDGIQMVVIFRQDDAVQTAHVRLLPAGRVSEVWIGDSVWLNDPDRGVLLENRSDVIGQLARKGEEVAILTRNAAA